MTKLAVKKDLFGKSVKQHRRPRYEAALERGEKRTLPERAARVRWLSEIIPRKVMFGLPLETALLIRHETNARLGRLTWYGCKRRKEVIRGGVE